VTSAAGRLSDYRRRHRHRDDYGFLCTNFSLKGDGGRSLLQGEQKADSKAHLVIHCAIARFRMSLFNNRTAVLAAVVLLATSACGGSNSVPSGAGVGNSALQLSAPQGGAASAVDNTSILKKFKKDVVIGSTVDPTNGDTGPHGLSQSSLNYGVIKNHQLIVCNYADSTGTAGNGTTIEILDPIAGSKPTRYVGDNRIKGCGASVVTSANSVYAAGLAAGQVCGFDQKGRFKKCYGSPLMAPFGGADAANPQHYAAEYIFASDVKTGSLVSWSVDFYGNPNELQVVTGFAVNNGSGWGVLGPSGLQYQKRTDMIYVVDGVTNTVVKLGPAGNLLQKDEIVVRPGGKTFNCKHKSVACAKLIYSGSPLNAPVAAALLPNGNLIVANTVGGNKLVEISAAGKLLATKFIDKSSVAHVFAMHAAGTSDANTVLFYTDTKDNSVHELEQ
jgi:hypothetical protein